MTVSTSIGALVISCHVPSDPNINTDPLLTTEYIMPLCHKREPNFRNILLKNYCWKVYVHDKKKYIHK